LPKEIEMKLKIWVLGSIGRWLRKIFAKIENIKKLIPD